MVSSSSFPTIKRCKQQFAKLCYFKADCVQSWEKYLSKKDYEETLNILKDNGVEARSKPYNELAKRLIKEGAGMFIPLQLDRQSYIHRCCY
jgi:hypothetical protein